MLKRRRVVCLLFFYYKKIWGFKWLKKIRNLLMKNRLKYIWNIYHTRIDKKFGLFIKIMHRLRNKERNAKKSKATTFLPCWCKRKSTMKISSCFKFNLLFLTLPLFYFVYSRYIFFFRNARFFFFVCCCLQSTFKSFLWWRSYIIAINGRRHYFLTSDDVNGLFFHL